MAKATARGRSAAWKRPGSPIGRKGPRKANPKYKRNMRKDWTEADVRMLRQLARQNTPTGVISLKLGRTPVAIRGKAQREGISLMPPNRSPYTRRKKTLRGAAASAAARKRAANGAGRRKTASRRGR